MEDCQEVRMIKVKMSERMMLILNVCRGCSAEQ